MTRPSVVVTGASSGLGAELARQLAGRGYDVGLCARRADRLDALAAEISTAHPEALVEVAVLDVTDPEAVTEVFGKFAAAFGRLDRVVVNAGVAAGAPVGSGRPEANRETAVTNVLGALHQCEAALQHFREQGSGHLVLVSSVSALRGMPGSMAVYAASKAAVATLGEGLLAERIPGIDVSVVLPRDIRTEMNAGTPPGRFGVDTATGVREIVEAIETRRPRTYVPAWPWRPLGAVLRVLPLTVARRLP